MPYTPRFGSEKTEKELTPLKLLCGLIIVTACAAGFLHVLHPAIKAAVSLIVRPLLGA